MSGQIEMSRRQFLKLSVVAAGSISQWEIDRRLDIEKQRKLIQQSVATFGTFWVTQKGDTLWDIAAKCYGDPLLYSQIMREDKQVVDNPRRLQIGQRLYLPPDYNKIATLINLEKILSTQISTLSILRFGHSTTDNSWLDEWTWTEPDIFPGVINIHRSAFINLASLPEIRTKVDIFGGWQHDKPVVSGVITGCSILPTQDTVYGTKFWERYCCDPSRMAIITCHPPDSQDPNPPQRLIFDVQF